MYVTDIKPIVIYAANVWGPVASKLSIRRILDELQRGFAQKICKAYRTVSLTTAIIRADLLPLELWAGEVHKLYRSKRGELRDEIVVGPELERPVRYNEYPHPTQGDV